MTRTALVVRSTGSWYDVVDAASQERMAVRAAGRLRLKGDRATNPIAVGDRVEVDEKGAIVSIHPRKNVIQRKSVNLSHAHHTIASNLDAESQPCIFGGSEHRLDVLQAVVPSV